jgi:hypothetical protein
MKNTDWKSIAELIGIAAIVASLIFVGLQMRQTHEIALATLYQMRSDAARELRLVRVDPMMLDRSESKARNGESLDDDDIRRFNAINGALFNHFESSHYLFQLGYVPAEHWEGDKRKIARLLRAPIRREFWNSRREDFRESFAAEIDELITEHE